MDDVEKKCSREEDFYRDNEDYLNERRKKLDIVRKEIKIKKSKEPHWLRCPKCGSEMHEFKLLGILIDKCEGCNGLFFDNGELETLLDISDRRGFFSSIKNNFYN
ncbi:MAG: zf-TFIIB domain-containing protein [Bacteriovoracaceae bacterium]|nr:zf-TFIIB domain-containing protein [Bacteriovoracaceae bacterium]